MRYLATLFLGAAAALLAGPWPVAAQIDARMFRYPDISATHITFVYAGDIWIVPKEGGVASHLSSPAGEEAFPRFSPDGSQIAFSANYDGNLDVYVVPAMGGDPVRVTHHPAADRLVDWHPDGTRVLFASQRESGRQRFNQFFLASAEGGLPEKLPVPYGEFAAFSPDGKELVYLPQSQAFRTWKRYRGGWAPDVWLFNLASLDAKNISASDAIDEHPMWHGNTIYFVSDRGPTQRHNVWAYDRSSGAVRQVTRFDEFDIRFPAIGPSDMVFEAGGRLYRLDLQTEQVAEVAIRVVTDRSTLKTRVVKVGDSIRSASVSPTGKRAVFEARGDAFTVPAEHGPVLDVTRSSGVAERYPRWSPDGKTLAYWTDRSGEYELALRSVNGAGKERIVTKLGPGYRYPPQWSPDSTRVAFADEKLQIQIYDIARNEAKVIDQSPIFMDNGALQRLPIRWSADSRWVVWARPDAETRNSAVFLYDTKTGERHQVSSGYFQDSSPVFDPEGRYLYFFSNRNFEPVYSDFDNSWTYPNATRIVAVPLRNDVASPLAARNDVEGEDEEEQEEEEGTDEKEEEEEEGEPDEAESKQDEKDDDAEDKKEEPRPVEIDIEGFEARAVVLPPKPGNYADLYAVEGKVLYRRVPRTGSGGDKSPIVYFDLEAREEKTVLDDADRFEPTFDGKKLFVLQEKKYAMVKLDEKQKFEKPMRTAEMEAVIDPAAEWRQMFTDAYRLERDFFYDPNMHGVDWAATRDRYAKLLDAAVTRWDVNFVLGEFIAELNSSHTYRGGGDQQRAPSRGVGMLGVDWALENGAYRIAHIVSGWAWSADVRSPLAEPGVDVEQGDYVLAVNAVPLDTRKDPWAAFQGLANQTVVLTVNDKPTADGARRVVVKCLASETELRFRAWVEERRQRVAEATKGRVGYVYVQSTGRAAQNELIRQFMAAWRKDGLIIDERFNSGGQIPDRFVELLNRPILSYWAVRHGEDWQWPPVAHRGPQVMRIRQHSHGARIRSSSGRSPRCSTGSRNSRTRRRVRRTSAACRRR